MISANISRYAAIVLLSMLTVVPTATADPAATSRQTDYQQLKAAMTSRYGTVAPAQWGESVSGVKTRIKGGDRVIALTFDACGSARGMGFDSRLIEYLEKNQVPATLFINDRWIEPNRAAFDRLSNSPLFEIANHGYGHKPASVTGRSIYGINGTNSVAEVVDEIELNAVKIAALTGRRPRHYRSGTAYYDEVAVQIAGELGHQVAGFSVLGDAGATYTREQVRKALLGASAGSIVILHMNRPESGTAAGVMDAIPELLKKGYRFVRLSDVELE